MHSADYLASGQHRRLDGEILIGPAGVGLLTVGPFSSLEFVLTASEAFPNAVGQVFQYDLDAATAVPGGGCVLRDGHLPPGGDPLAQAAVRADLSILFDDAASRFYNAAPFPVRTNVSMPWANTGRNTQPVIPRTAGPVTAVRPNLPDHFWKSLTRALSRRPKPEELLRIATAFPFAFPSEDGSLVRRPCVCGTRTSTTPGPCICDFQRPGSEDEAFAQRSWFAVIAGALLRHHPTVQAIIGAEASVYVDETRLWRARPHITILWHEGPQRAAVDDAIMQTPKWPFDTTLRRSDDLRSVQRVNEAFQAAWGLELPLFLEDDSEGSDICLPPHWQALRLPGNQSLGALVRSVLIDPATVIPRRFRERDVKAWTHHKTDPAIRAAGFILFGNVQIVTATPRRGSGSGEPDGATPPLNAAVRPSRVTMR